MKSAADRRRTGPGAVAATYGLTATTRDPMRSCRRSGSNRRRNADRHGQPWRFREGGTEIYRPETRKP